MNKCKSGKVVPVLLIIIILMAAAFAAGYYVSWMQYKKKASALRHDFSSFEGKYEKTLTSLRSDIVEIKSYIKEKEGETEQETQQLRMKSILLKAKGEIISSKLALARGEVDQSLQFLNNSISVLKEAYEMAGPKTKEHIEDIRLQLATVRGLIQVDPEKAQQELDALWRKIETILP